MEVIAKIVLDENSHLILLEGCLILCEELMIFGVLMKDEITPPLRAALGGTGWKQVVQEGEFCKKIFDDVQAKLATTILNDMAYMQKVLSLTLNNE